MVFLFLEFLGGSNTVCGITVAVTVVFEIPMFHIAPAMLRKYGVGWLLLLACAAFWIRVMGYTMIPEGQPWWILLLEWLHGFTYAGAQSSAVEFVTQQMPPGLEASGQGIVNFVCGMASIIGLYAGGALQDAFGPRVMYRVFVAAVTVGMTLLAVVRCKYPSEQEQARYDPIPDVSESSRHWDVVHRRNSSRSSSIRDLNRFSYYGIVQVSVAVTLTQTSKMLQFCNERQYYDHGSQGRYFHMSSMRKHGLFSHHNNRQQNKSRTVMLVRSYRMV